VCSLEAGQDVCNPSALVFDLCAIVSWCLRWPDYMNDDWNVRGPHLSPVLCVFLLTGYMCILWRLVFVVFLLLTHDQWLTDRLSWMFVYWSRCFRVWKYDIKTTTVIFFSMFIIVINVHGDSNPVFASSFHSRGYVI